MTDKSKIEVGDKVSLKSLTGIVTLITADGYARVTLQHGRSFMDLPCKVSDLVLLWKGMA